MPPMVYRQVANVEKYAGVLHVYLGSILKIINRLLKPPNVIIDSQTHLRVNKLPCFW